MTEPEFVEPQTPSTEETSEDTTGMPVEDDNPDASETAEANDERQY